MLRDHIAIAICVCVCWYIWEERK